MALNLSSLMAQWQQKQEGARLANIKRSEQITAIYDEIIKRYEPGGTFGQAALGQLEKQKVRDVGGEMQQMISSGLYGTTTAAGGGRRWEEAVGAPARLRLEDIMMQRLSQAQVGKAGFMERIEEPYPDYGAMMGAMQTGAAAPTRQPTTTWGQYDPDYMTSLFGARGGTGGGETFGAGQSPLQLRLAEQNRARATAESQRRGQTTTTVGAVPTATTPVQQIAGDPTSLAVGTQMGSILGKPGEGEYALMQSAYQKYQAITPGKGAGLSTEERRVMKQYRGTTALKQVWGQA